MRTFNLCSSEDVCAELGARIKRFRLMRNLTQQEVAYMTLASLSSIRRLESHGHGSLLLLVRFATAVQALSHFDSLFNEPIQTIAQAEREEALAMRKRSRRVRSLEP
jgi:transcriptional regulator with XRE-family HTH domain